MGWVGSISGVFALNPQLLFIIVKVISVGFMGAFALAPFYDFIRFACLCQEDREKAVQVLDLVEKNRAQRKSKNETV